MRFVLLFPIILCTAIASAQELLPPISLRSHSIKEFEAQAIGDSVLMTWTSIQMPSQAVLVYRFLIKPDKTVQPIGGMPGIIGEIVKIEDHGDKLKIINAVDERRATVFREITYDKEKKVLRPPQEIFRTRRKDIIGVVPTDGLLILSEDSNEDSLVVTQIDKQRQVRESKFLLADQILKLRTYVGPKLSVDKEWVSLFHSGTKSLPVELSASLKFFVDGNNLTITRDRPNRPNGNFKGYTQMIEIDLAGGRVKRSLLIGEPTFNRFTSYFFDGYLFRIGMDRDFNLQKLFRMTIYKGDSLTRTIEFKNEFPYVRSGKYYERNSLSIAEKYGCINALGGDQIFAQPERDKSGKIFLKIGSHYFPKRSSTPATSGGSPTTTISTPDGVTTINTGISTTWISTPLSISETEGEDRYFYLSGGVESGFEYTQGKDFLDYQIDMYELKQAEEAKFRFKRYLKTKKYTYAFYRRKGNDEIEVVRFDNGQ